ncbi:CpsD/CapB family tyrosine-protein kinase [Cytobacillus firmus]|uniref:CpsD/CapB family tyrosine-protein kinase n=1 Tax=Cytobacillus firmus TaxID=1399 RepID=UPI003BA2EC83
MVLKARKTNKQNSKRSLITHSDSRSPISEQYRTIRTNIQYSAVDEDLRTIMVTSAGPGEGKSTTAANLAVVFAQQGKRVLLIDADLRKPTMHYTFHQNNHKGLTNILTKQANLKDASVETDIENLSILTSGPIPPNPAEILGSQSMDGMIEEALGEYDLVIFDTPPVLAVTDAQILANKCDGAILVVKSENTEVEASLKSKELLLNAKGKLLGVVLNQKKVKDNQYYYCYGGK